MPDIVRVATVNTQTGRLLGQPDALSVFAKDQVDILLLQEVFGAEEPEVARKLHLQGYRLIAFDRSTGLAIALHIHSRLVVSDRAGKIIILQKRGGAAELMTRHSIIPEHHTRARGILTVVLQTPSGQEITAVTTHPTVFIRHRARTKHLRLLQDYLSESYTTVHPLFLGADMNHYPRAGRYDIAFRKFAQFREVPIDDVTWPIKGTKYEWLARAASRISRRPIDTFNGQLDTILYRGDGIQHMKTKVIHVESDHRAIISHFSLG